MNCYHRLQIAIFSAIAAMAVSTAAESQALIHQIDQPLPLEFRGRAAALIREIRPADAAAAIQNTKALLWPANVKGEALIILRVEAGCPAAGNCMTVIGQMTDRGIKPEVTLEVRPTVIVADSSVGLWGTPSSAPFIFDAGGGVGLAAVSRDQGWVISACVDCTNWGSLTGHLQNQVTQPLRQSFEEFQRALDFHRR